MIAFALSLLFLQPATLTVQDCLYRHGDSHRITEPSLLAQIAGINAWNDGGQDALRYGVAVASGWVDTDTGSRLVRLYQYHDVQYLFVFRHYDAPGAREAMPDGRMAWHGSCMLRIG